MEPPKRESDKKDKRDARRQPPSTLRPSRPLSPSDRQEVTQGFIPAHGGYESLLAYQKALVVYDGTRYFCDRFLNKRDRTYDQMVQAARSGKQTILQRTQPSPTSKKPQTKPPPLPQPSHTHFLQ